MYTQYYRELYEYSKFRNTNLPHLTIHSKQKIKIFASLLHLSMDSNEAKKKTILRQIELYFNIGKQYLK